MTTDVDASSAALARVASWVRRVTPRDALNAVALSALDALATEGPQRVTDLVARERISQPGMTSVVNRLAEAGLVERNADPQDGRATLVTITDAGRAHLAAFHAARVATFAEHVSRLPGHHQQALHDAVAALDALTTHSVQETPA